MDILAGLRDKLRFIERHYRAASEPFREKKRKIEAGEEPFAPPTLDPENPPDSDPPFLGEWLEADESLNLEGEAALKLVHRAFHDYLEWFVTVRSTAPVANRGAAAVRRSGQVKTTTGAKKCRMFVETARLSFHNRIREGLPTMRPGTGADRRERCRHIRLSQVPGRR